MKSNLPSKMYKPLVRHLEQSEPPTSQQKATQSKGSLVTSTGNVRSVSAVQSTQSLMLPPSDIPPIPTFKIYFYAKPPTAPSPPNEQSTTSTNIPPTPPDTTELPTLNIAKSDALTEQPDEATQKGKHLKSELFTCPECRKGFSVKGIFIRHLDAHLSYKNRPYMCPLCGKRFSMKFNLKVHQRIHTGEKPYNCSLCPETFTYLSTLRSHIRTHTDGKPYACQCKAGFTTAKELQTHKTACNTGNSQDRPNTSSSTN